VVEFYFLGRFPLPYGKFFAPKLFIIWQALPKVTV
jgi:hypothetical protein